MREKRLGTYLPLLLLLAISTIAVAGVTLTNITEWHIQATQPPIYKAVGADANQSDGLIGVDWYTAGDGTNRTRIIIKGFKGDITHYDEAIKICNRDTSNSYSVSLVYQGVISGDWSYVEYLELTPGTAAPLHIDSTTSTGTSSGSVTVGPGSCVSVSADLLVHPDAPEGADLLVLQVDVQATRV